MCNNMIRKFKIWLRNAIGLVVYNTIRSTSQDLGIMLQERATLTTCAYVEANMLNIHSQVTRFGVLEVALAHIMVDGCNLEFGVYKGRTINYIARQLKGGMIYGFDSFEGLPEFWRDGSDKGLFDMQGKLPKVHDNVQLIKGWFDSTIPTFLEGHTQQIAFLHIDCDIYSSTKIILEQLGPYIQKGTVIVFDEYFNYPGWEQGEFKAFQEFVAKYRVRYRYLTYNRKHEQVAMIIESITIV